MIDLRTDFISTPTPAMVEAMVRAAGAPAGFGLRDDPFVAALEARAAEVLGKEDALFCPTCMAANQIAIQVTCRPGDGVLTEETNHIVTSEGGAPAALGGAMIQAVAGRRGEVPIDRLIAVMDGGDPVQSRTHLVVLENTHVRSGGTVLGLAHMAAVRTATRERGIPVHLDGSRIFNAATALGVPARELAQQADSVSASRNKGLSAPMGAILAGSRPFIQEAVRIRHRLGCSWRPAGIPAAAALVALDTMVDRLSEDHRQAADLAEGLRDLPGLRIDPEQVQTNIVLVDVDPRLGSPPETAALLEGQGVPALPFGPRQLRLVTWHRIGAQEVSRTVEAFGAVLRELGPSRPRPSRRPTEARAGAGSHPYFNKQHAWEDATNG